MTMIGGSIGIPGNAEYSEEWREMYTRTVAAVSEGFCPGCSQPMEAVICPRGLMAGHCIPCRRYWGANIDTDVAGWWIDWDPRQPERYTVSVPVPDWFAVKP